MPVTATAGLHAFLIDYPMMAMRSVAGMGLVLEGTFEFAASHKDFPRIEDSYELTITVPSCFPRDLPRVTESGRRIPRDGNHHVNPDGTLCLGSRLRLLWVVSKAPTLVGFARNCLVPYLYSISHKLKFGGGFAFSELEHGSPGELKDYADLLGLKTPEQARQALRLLGLKKRHANKVPCPCGCKKRLGRCRFNFKIREFRQLAARSWFKEIAV